MQLDNYKNAKKTLKQIDRNPENYFIIHYSCENFFETKDGQNPRITSIAVYHFSTGQTASFSIHKTAEKNGLMRRDIPAKYDKLEKEMLDEFFDYVRVHSESIWIHWNMRNIHYGFNAIEHRFEVLGGNPVIIAETKKIDLSSLLKDKYGEHYIDHPRFTNLIELNKIGNKDILQGQAEALAFKKRDYLKVQASTLGKVQALADILKETINNTLKVNSKWKERYGISAQGIFEFCQDTWWIRIITYIVTLILGAILGRII